MNYKLIKSSSDDIEKLINYKKKIIYEYAKDLSENEIIPESFHDIMLKNIPSLIRPNFLLPPM